MMHSDLRLELEGKSVCVCVSNLHAEGKKERKREGCGEAEERLRDRDESFQSLIPPNFYFTRHEEAKVRKAYFKLAQKYHPDKNPDGRVSKLDGMNTRA